jgi:2-hydroxy-6-oxonona-2,4-dienedioate hydrolase
MLGLDLIDRVRPAKIIRPGLTHTHMRITKSSNSTSSARGRLVSEYVRVDGVTMHALVSAGAAAPGGVPTVLVHGLIVSSRYMMPLAQILAADTRVYAPDLPGYGKSEWNGRANDVPSLAAALDRWMEVVGLEQAIVVANSFGCQIAARLAASSPRRVGQLVLLGPMVEPRARNLLALAARGIANVPLEPPLLGAIIARDLWAMGIPRALAQLRAMLTDRIDVTVRAISAPTLIVRGQRDPLVSKRWAHALARLLPAGRVAQIPDAGHALNYNAPDRVAALVRSLIHEPREIARAS